MLGRGLADYKDVINCEDRPRPSDEAGLPGVLTGAYPLPMRYIFVPQTGHAPCVAGLPFFMVTAFASFISRCVRHFRQ